jgi:hypothetical protein
MTMRRRYPMTMRTRVGLAVAALITWGVILTAFIDLDRVLAFL